MHNAVYPVLAAVTGLAIVAMTVSAGEEPAKRERPKGPIVEFTGKVVHVALEGGFEAIVADNGTRYVPLKLAPEFSGKRVKVRGRVRKDVVGYQMWGLYLEIIEISALTDADAPPPGQARDGGPEARGSR